VHRPTSAVWITQAYKQGPADNALKGFIPYAGSFTTFPYSMEWFYIPWKDIQSGYNIYTWATLDDQLKTIADRGHQAVFRIYADYPKRAYGLPAFLSYVPKNAYTDNGNTSSFSPDYENADLRRAMKNLIAALGARYDGDARIGFIEVGFLGFWGEWHTYPHTAWFPSVTVQNEVLDAFETAFAKTKVLMREPKAGIHPVTRRIGYHDDSFAYNTYGATPWYFWPKLLAAGERLKWRTQPIGGELRPEIQLTQWQDSSLCQAGDPAGEQQCYNVCVDSTHASWMLAHSLFSPGNSGAPHARALEGAARLGYDIFVSSVALAETLSAYAIDVSVKMTNRGVAPFYYDWPVRLSVLDASNTAAASWDTPWRLTEVVDRGAETVFSFSGRAAGLPVGSYTLVMAAVNPLPNGKQLVFANERWGQDVPGALTLGRFAVTVVTHASDAQPAAAADGWRLSLNFPNPFNPSTTIAYELPLRTHVTIDVTDILGRTVRTLVNEEQPAGRYSTRWDGLSHRGARAASGVYFYCMRTDAYTAIRKMLLLQ